MKHLSRLLALCLLLCMAFSAAAESEITIPEIPMKEFEIPENDALAFVADMKAGFSLGNTMDAFDCTWLSDPMDYEKGWVGIRTTEEMIQAFCDAGFRTMRLPVSWHNHVTPVEENGVITDWVIDDAWLDRVEEILSWAKDRGMYMILNIHHDDSPDYYYPDSDHLENSTRYMRSIWTQLATRFASWDDHLIFEGINEPRLKGTDHEWYWDPNDASCQDSMACICALNQVFVDTVRACGGENETRYLMVPSYAANAGYACVSAFTLPEDTADNRVIVSVHAYTPYDFALNTSGTDVFDLNNMNQKSEIGSFMNTLYETWVSKGIPVVIDEFGAVDKHNLQSRVDFTAYYVTSARARGMTTCWWDNHAYVSGECFGLLDREKLTWVYPEIVEAIMRCCE